MTDEVRLPRPVRESMAGMPDVGVAEQALPLLTTDIDGQPRAMLLSRAEVDTRSGATGDEVFCVLRSSTSRSNLRRTCRATLLVVTADTLHSIYLRVARVLQHEDLQGVALYVRGVKADSVGIPLQPIRYAPTEELIDQEHWKTSADLLERLQAGDGL